MIPRMGVTNNNRYRINAVPLSRQLSDVLYDAHLGSMEVLALVEESLIVAANLWRGGARRHVTAVR